MERRGVLAVGQTTLELRKHGCARPKAMPRSEPSINRTGYSRSHHLSAADIRGYVSHRGRRQTARRLAESLWRLMARWQLRRTRTMSTSQLLRAVAQLSWEDFQEFMSRAVALQPVPPEAPRLSRRETALLLKINAGPPPEWQPYTKLLEKRRAGRVSPRGKATARWWTRWNDMT